MWQALFFEISTKYIPHCQNNPSFFFEKVFLKGISPVDHTLQQHKNVLQLKYFFFWVFENLPYYNSYYTTLTALGELILIITIRVEHVTCASAPLFAW